MLLRLAKCLEREGFVCTQLEIASEHHCLGVLFPCAIRVAMKDGRKAAPFLLLPKAAAALSQIAVPPIVVGDESQAAGVWALIEESRELAAQNRRMFGQLRAQYEFSPESWEALTAQKTAAEAEAELLHGKLRGLRREYEELYALWERTDEGRRVLARQLAASSKGDKPEIEETPLPGPDG